MTDATDETNVTDDTAPEGFDDILAYVKSVRGFDFTGYKPASLQRRVTKRMEETGSTSYVDYLDRLQVYPEEFRLLFNTILINVTGFFRDPDAWAVIRDEVIPAIIARKSATEPIRIWSAGCASGEEAYTLAILLREAIGDDDTYLDRVKIYATDVDEDALDQARQGVYPAARLDDVPEELRERYFVRAGDQLTFRKDLRRTLIFGRNDLVQDAPISRVDLLTCRNTLMYFNAETQSHILRRFHFALGQEGSLFLGKSEMLLSRGEFFRPIDLRRRIFAPVVTAKSIRERSILGGEFQAPAYHREWLVDAVEYSSVAQIVVDRDRTLALANGAARSLLEITAEDVGRPLQDLRVSYRPVELRGDLDAVFSEARPVNAGTIVGDYDGESRAIEVQLTPIMLAERVTAVNVTFIDVTRQQRLETELERCKGQLDAVYQELQSTIEELETTNEELQSTNEELETTNEELQSTNEELETMNEELQSSNEELENANEELRARSLQLNETNAFMETILTNMAVGFVVIGQDRRVRLWNAQSQDLWGLRPDEAIGEVLVDLDIGLPVAELGDSIETTLRPGSPGVDLTLDAVDRKGRPFRCDVSLVPLGAEATEERTVMLLTRRAGSPVDTSRAAAR